MAVGVVEAVTDSKLQPRVCPLLPAEDSISECKGRVTRPQQQQRQQQQQQQQQQQLACLFILYTLENQFRINYNCYLL